jgi:hypothetical protein
MFVSILAEFSRRCRRTAEGSTACASQVTVHPAGTDLLQTHRQQEAVLDRCAIVHPRYARQTGRPPSPDRVRDNGRNSSRAPRGRRRAGIGPGCALLDGTESSSPARARGRDPRQATILPSVLPDGSDEDSDEGSPCT